MLTFTAELEVEMWRGVGRASVFSCRDGFGFSSEQKGVGQPLPGSPDFVRTGVLPSPHRARPWPSTAGSGNTRRPWRSTC